MNITTASSSLRAAFKPLLLAATVCLGGMAWAGEGAPRDPAARMAEHLALDATQAANVKTIFERNRPTQEALRARQRQYHEALHALDPEAADYSRRAQALADEAGTLARDRVLQRTQLRGELAAVLTPEQLAKFDERRHPGRGKHGHARKTRKARN